MTGWTGDELAAIDRADELDLRSERADHTLRAPVTIWVVRHGDDLYVRPVKGRDGWHKGTRTRGRGHITSGGVDRDVTFTDATTDPALNDALDEAYRTKYHSYADDTVGPVTNAQSRTATIRLLPR